VGVGIIVQNRRARSNGGDSATIAQLHDKDVKIVRPDKKVLKENRMVRHDKMDYVVVPAIFDERAGRRPLCGTLP
jgi:hypothetical protein